MHDCTYKVPLGLLIMRFKAVLCFRYQPHYIVGNQLFGAVWLLFIL